MSGPSLQFPTPPGFGGAPIWDGRSFIVDGKRLDILRYPVGESGWDNTLTELHKALSNGQHFIDRASRRRAVDALLRYCPAGCTIMEVGVSEGHLMKDMQAANPTWRLFGADYTYETLTLVTGLRAPVPLLQFNLTKCPLPDESIDGVVALNVLEHIEHDDVAVAQCFRILRPGGTAVIEVPAGPELFDDYDRELMHFRRYRLDDLVNMFMSAGFVVVEQTHIGFLLYPAFLTYKKLSRLRGTAVASVGNTGGENGVAHVKHAIGFSSRLGYIGRGLMAIENVVRRFGRLPFGVRCHLVCRKPADR